MKKNSCPTKIVSFMIWARRASNWTKSKLLLLTSIQSTSSCPGVFYKKGIFRNFAKFRGKHLFQGLFFNKVGSLRPVTVIRIHNTTLNPVTWTPVFCKLWIEIGNKTIGLSLF